MIADKAGLKIAPWDGYLKYYNLAEKYPDMVEKQRKTYAEKLKKWTLGVCHGYTSPNLASHVVHVSVWAQKTDRHTLHTYPVSMSF